MKVCLKGFEESFDKEQMEVIEKFIKFLNSQLRLKENLIINFMSLKTKKMTTGSNNKNHQIYVLTKNRLLIDILRTLSHEWVHEFQRPIPKNKKVKKIGGLEENMANILSGIFMKKFQKEYPKFEKILYGES